MLSTFQAAEGIKLVYFRRYSDFCFAVGEDFRVMVSENADGFTQIHGINNNVSRLLVIFRQPAIEVFRGVSPTDFIYQVSEYLWRLYLWDEQGMFGNMEEMVQMLQ